MNFAGLDGTEHTIRTPVVLTPVHHEDRVCYTSCTSVYERMNATFKNALDVSRNEDRRLRGVWVGDRGVLGRNAG